ncbi:MAG: rod shape-determining protein MreD [Planctomycetia bacterium]
MLGVIAVLGWLLLAAALPDLLPDRLGLVHAGPDLWVALVVYLACRGRGYAAVGWAVVVGVCRDVQSLDPLGTHAFVLGLVALVFAEGARDRGRVGAGTRAACLLAGGVLAAWAYTLRMLPLGGGLSGRDLLAAFPVAAWTVVAAAPLYAISDALRLFDDVLGRRRHGLPA